MTDMVPRQDGSIDLVGGEPIPADNQLYKVLRFSRERAEKTAGDVRRMLVTAVQLLSGADIISKVKAGIEYVVQVPAQYQEELAAGTLQMMQGEKSGKMWATLVRKLESGKQEIVANCPITETMRIQGNPIQNIAGVYQSIYMQQLLAEVSDQVQDVFDVVKQIEQGQTDDRIGKLIAGRNDLQRALMNPNVAGRQRELELARQMISEGQGQIGASLQSRIENFSPVASSPVARVFREIASPRTNYLLESPNRI